MSRHVMSCHVMSCHVMSCHVMSCHVMSCHVMSCHVMSCHVMSCHVMSCHVMSCHVMSCHVMSCHVMSCHVMSCHVMSCHVMSCHVMSCHVMSCVTQLLQFSPCRTTARPRPLFAINPEEIEKSRTGKHATCQRLAEKECCGEMHSTFLYEKRANMWTVKVRRTMSLCTTGRWTCFCLLAPGNVSERLLVDEMGQKPCFHCMNFRVQGERGEEKRCVFPYVSTNKAARARATNISDVAKSYHKDNLLLAAGCQYAAGILRGRCEPKFQLKLHTRAPHVFPPNSRPFGSFGTWISSVVWSWSHGMR